MTNKNVPKLRFSEYTDEWELYSLDDLTTAIQSGKSNKNINAMYNLYGSTGCIGKTNSIEIKGESILIARVGANAGTVQYINDICGVSDNTLIIKLKNDLNYKFLYYSLIIYNFNKIIVNSGRPLITASDLKTIRIQIPSIDEQKKIACFLYNIDKKIELLKDKKEGFVEFKHYLLQNLFPQNDEKTPKLRFPEFTDEWNAGVLSDMTDVITKGTTPAHNDFVDSNINFIKIENIVNSSEISENNILTISKECHDNKLSRSKLEEHDILFSIAGALGKTLVVSKEMLPANTNQALAIIRLKDKKQVDYVNYYLNLEKIKKFIYENVTIGAQPNLSLKQIGEIKINIPSKEEKNKISTFFNYIDKKIDLLHEKKEEFIEFKQYLLQNLFPQNGENVPK